MLNPQELVLFSDQLNKAISLDPPTFTLLQGLPNTVINIHCTKPDIWFCITIKNGIIHLAQHKNECAQAGLSGNAIRLITALRHSYKNTCLEDSKLKYWGNLIILQRLNEIIHFFVFDWEAILCRYFGNMLGHNLAISIKAISNKTAQIHDNMMRNITEYLNHEIGILPSNEEAQDFYIEIKQLHYQVEKLTDDFASVFPSKNLDI